MGLLRDDLLNVCMRHVEKICKADLGRNFIERNHMENGRVSEISPSLPCWAKPSSESEEMKCDKCALTEEKLRKDLRETSPVVETHSRISELSYQTYVGTEAVELPGI